MAERKSDWVKLTLENRKAAHIRMRWVRKVEYGSRDRLLGTGQTVMVPVARILYYVPGAMPETLTCEGEDDVNFLHELLDGEQGYRAA